MNDRRPDPGTNKLYTFPGVENGVAESPLDRKDALTRRPLDFDQEEETRKVETTKWLEHHFGSDSRSSNQSSTIDEEEPPPKTSFFNVTIKSQPTRSETPQKTFISTVNSNGNPRVYSPVEPERDRNDTGGYYKGERKIYFEYGWYLAPSCSYYMLFYSAFTSFLLFLFTSIFVPIFL